MFEECLVRINEERSILATHGNIDYQLGTKVTFINAKKSSIMMILVTDNFFVGMRVGFFHKVILEICLHKKKNQNQNIIIKVIHRSKMFDTIV